MRLKLTCLGLLISILLCASACSSAAQTPEPTAEPTPTATAVMRSKTSGQVLEAEVEYKPIGVMIENSSAARPQIGLQAADVVYEAPVEGSITRFLCIFNDTLPESVGPVRSARLYYIRFAQEWDCAYTHFGGPESGNSNVYTDAAATAISTRIDLIKGQNNNYYWRTGNKGVHTVHTNVVELQTLVDEESQGRTFLFDENTTYVGDTFTEVALPFNGSDVLYTYDASRDLLIRYQTVRNSRMQIRMLQLKLKT